MCLAQQTRGAVARKKDKDHAISLTHYHAFIHSLTFPSYVNELAFHLTEKKILFSPPEMSLNQHDGAFNSSSAIEGHCWWLMACLDLHFRQNAVVLQCESISIHFPNAKLTTQLIVQINVLLHYFPNHQRHDREHSLDTRTCHQKTVRLKMQQLFGKQNTVQRGSFWSHIPRTSNPLESLAIAITIATVSALLHNV